MFVGLVRRYLDGLMDPFVTLLEVHKLMYFMQEAGESFGLRYVPAPYGPYAENLKQVLSAAEDHLISGYPDGDENPDKELELVPGAVEDAETYLANHPATHTRLERVAHLVEGFESAFGLELLSTVHWVAPRSEVTKADDVVASTYAWGDRKQQFSTRQIHLALDVLRKNAWLMDHEA